MTIPIYRVTGELENPSGGDMSRHHLWLRTIEMILAQLVDQGETRLQPLGPKRAGETLPVW